MNKITKEMCTAFIEEYYWSNHIVFLVSCIFALFFVWILTKSMWVVGFVAIVLLLVLLVFFFKTKQKIKHIDFNEFYLVEDVVLDFKKRFRLKRNGAARHYIYIFKDHGKHTIEKSVYPTIEISLHKRKHACHAQMEELTIQSGDQGDLFYLLVCKSNQQIVQCFPKYHFDVAQDDFDFIDGKYYCKQ